MRRSDVPTDIGPIGGAPYGAGIGRTEVAEMLTREIAKAQIDDRVRAAEMARSARTAGRRVRGPRVATRSIGSGMFVAIRSLRLTGNASETRAATVA